MVDVSDVSKTLYIDRYGISTLEEFTTRMYARFKNQSPQLVYVKAIILNTTEWTFDNGSTSKNLGSIDAFGYSDKYFTLKRAVPTADIEESFTMKFEFYKDSGYTKKLEEVTKTVYANIIDFRNSTEWTSELTDFEDGTEQGWTLNLFSISQDASIEAGGYSAYYYLSGTTATKYPSIEKTISIPAGVTKAGIIFYYGAHLFSGWNGKYARFNYTRVYVNGELIFEDYINAAVDYNPTHKYIGWYQSSVDLTEYAGQNITVKIEFELHLDKTSSMWIKSALDDIIFAYK